MRVKTFASCNDAASALEWDLSHTLCDLHRNKAPVLLLSSGESAIKLLNGIDIECLGPHLTVSVLDERHDPTNESSNFAGLAHTQFYEKSLISNVRWIDTRAKPDESFESHGERFNREITRWIDQHPAGEIVATIGMGVNGHVAGIMPYPEDFEMFNDIFLTPEWIISYDASGKDRYTQRMTASVALLHKIDHAFGFTCGEADKPALQKAFQKGLLSAVPARIFQELRGTLYTDIEL